MPFTFIQSELPGIVIIEPKIFFDERGFFYESYKYSDFSKNGIDVNFVQDNHSLSSKGVLRGMHFQMNPRAQGKLVRVIKGIILDVVIDIRSNSDFFKNWFSIELSDENRKMLYIPPGFAHGFLTITDDVHLVYKCTEEYFPEYDAGIRWDDPDINIRWPIKKPIVSDKDKELPFLKNINIF